MISKKVTELPSQPGIPVVSLFSGCGGLDLGFFQAGFRSVLAVDFEKAACITYEANHTHVRVLRKDLSDLNKGYISQRLDELPTPVKPVGIIGGPPCQAFSRGWVRSPLFFHYRTPPVFHIYTRKCPKG
jgi:DNA (cytosine-5)-methyltransferase 1